MMQAGENAGPLPDLASRGSIAHAGVMSPPLPAFENDSGKSTGHAFADSRKPVLIQQLFPLRRGVFGSPAMHAAIEDFGIKSVRSHVEPDLLQ